MQRQVPDFLLREASRIARRVPKRWAAIEPAPNHAGAVAALIPRPYVNLIVYHGELFE
jgi:hypothetical protein